LELVSDLPYGKTSEDSFDVKAAKLELDKDHFGMQKVKERILEFIAVAKLRNKIKGKNILMVGPPGVGKTSIASSIAKCLNREFIRISLGGESDVAILKGHRRTYIGAYPGKLVQALKTTQTENPVILLDEIDKISAGYRGNLLDTLLEVLDPQQNHEFRDNFLEAPLDLSKVLFVCTANLLETISAPVLDRLEVIELSGYTTDEKMEIAKTHLIPKALEKSGIEDFEIDFTEKGLQSII
jgi:ATP-dependent Lon protease